MKWELERENKPMKIDSIYSAIKFSAVLILLKTLKENNLIIIYKNISLSILYSNSYCSYSYSNSEIEWLG